MGKTYLLAASMTEISGEDAFMAIATIVMIALALWGFWEGRSAKKELKTGVGNLQQIFEREKEILAEDLKREMERQRNYERLKERRR